VRRRHRSSDRTERAAGQRTYPGTVPASGQPANCRARAGADRTATERTLSRIIGIGAGGQRHYNTKRCGSTCDETRHDIETS
jgi:hypothetical protein